MGSVRWQRCAGQRATAPSLQPSTLSPVPRTHLRPAEESTSSLRPAPPPQHPIKATIKELDEIPLHLGNYVLIRSRFSGLRELTLPALLVVSESASWAAGADLRILAQLRRNQSEP
jgi:hypothetical protein